MDSNANYLGRKISAQPPINKEKGKEIICIVAKISEELW
jgi:hypothetical protein